MNNESILLLTKDAQCKAYYPTYGNSYWKGKMPNFEELASKGTVFNRFYTAAPSSNMSYLSMFTMKNPYEQSAREYVGMETDYQGETFFNKLIELGYKCHIIWDDSWDPDVKYTRCYNGCHIHSIKDLKQGVGCHYKHVEPLVPDEEKALKILCQFKTLLHEICSGDEKIFIWCHLPHVLNGRVGYGGDMDLYDRYIGEFRNYFNDNNIFISADHGNMNGTHGKVCYGFDVYESSACIPLVTPRINGLSHTDSLVSNIDLWKIILERIIPERKFVLCDSAYYAQPRRKLMVAFGRYRYIFNKLDATEELYDIEWDPQQDFNLISDKVYDKDRNMECISSEYYFYPYWKDLSNARNYAREVKKSMWRIESSKTKVYNDVKKFFVKRFPKLYSKCVRVLVKFIPRNI